MRESLYRGFCFSGRMRRDEAVLLTLTLAWTANFFGEQILFLAPPSLRGKD